MSETFLKIYIFDFRTINKAKEQFYPKIELFNKKFPICIYSQEIHSKFINNYLVHRSAICIYLTLQNTLF